jgi:hypothetical protein
MKVIDASRSPFHRAAEEGLTGQRDDKSTTITKRHGRPFDGAPDWGPMFLAALTEGSSVTDAARQANVHVTRAYQRRRQDEAFRQAWKEAAHIGTECLEQEAARRAYHGTLKPVFHKGVECGTIREYSDTLMIFLLKARRPAVYREGHEDGTVRPVMLNVNVVNVDSDAPVVERTPRVIEQLPTVEIETV